MNTFTFAAFLYLSLTAKQDKKKRSRRGGKLNKFMGIIKSTQDVRIVYEASKSRSCEINKNYSNGKANISKEVRH